MKTQQLIVSMLLLLLLACSKDDNTPFTDTDPVQNQNPITEPEKSSDKQLISFRFSGVEKDGITVDIPAEIDQTTKSIGAQMPSGTDISSLEPEVEISDKASYEPTGPQDFSQPIIYTVTAEDGTSRSYLVTVAVALSQKEILLKIAEANPGSTLDWNENDNINDWGEVVLDGDGKVEELYLNRKNLTLIPPEIGQLDNLQFLSLHDNDLSEIPREIGQLENLQSLHLSDNNLSVLRPEIGQLSKLETLSLFKNNISVIPPEIGKLGNLQSLYLSDNNLSLLATEIGQLSNLKELALSNNNLSVLPPEIGLLGQLLALSLHRNVLTALPRELSQLTNLTFLDLSYNQLAGLGTIHIPMVNSDPFTISCASNLQELYLVGNKQPMVLDECICELDNDNGGTIDIDIVIDPNEPNPLVTCRGDVIGK